MLEFLLFVYGDTTAMIGFIFTIAVILYGTAEIVKSFRRPILVSTQTTITDDETEESDESESEI